MRQDRRRRVAAELRRKYERMRELRAAAAHGDDAEGRAALRQFAAEWPGALKELDTLPAEEIERRVSACTSDENEPWMAWMVRYHELMRAALALRRGESPEVAAEFADAVKQPHRGRLNVVVFAQLGREFGVEPRTIWDALFPARGRARRDYRD